MNKRTTRMLGVVVVALLTMLGFTASAAAGGHDPKPNITFCHATNSATNPYVVITTDAASIVQTGHGDHTGPVFDPAGGQHQPNWGDIIPAFDFPPFGNNPGGHFGGLNLSSAGLAILAAGCNVPSEPTPTPTTPTPTPTTPTPTPTETTPTPTPTETTPTSTPTATTPTPTPTTPTPTASTPTASTPPTTPTTETPAPEATATAVEVAPVKSGQPHKSRAHKPQKRHSTVPAVRTPVQTPGTQPITRERLPHTGPTNPLVAVVGLGLLLLGTGLVRMARAK